VLEYEGNTGTPDDPRQMIVAENDEVSSAFDERSDKCLDDAQQNDVYTLDTLFLGRAPR
jgi:hypothetical protein